MSVLFRKTTTKQEQKMNTYLDNFMKFSRQTWPADIETSGV